MKNLIFKRVLWLLIPLLTMFSIDAWGATITITKAALGATTYDADGSATISNVEFSWTDIMANGNNMQVRASTGELWNSSLVPGKITQVAVTSTGTARSSNLYWGTSAKASTNSQSFSGTATKTSPSGCFGYVYIKRGSNVAYWTQVVITYTPATITLSKSSITGLDYSLGSGPSASQTFIVSGSNIPANLIVTAPTNFEVSLNGSSWASSQTITVTTSGSSGGTLTATTVYVRLASGKAVGNYSGNVSIAMNGCNTISGVNPKTVAVGGTVSSAGTSVTLTKAGETNGTISLSPTGPLTTTGSSASTTVTASPSAGYYLSNLTASNPSTGTATVTGSGNTRTVTYSSGANGSSTITATFSPIWQLRGDFNSWGTTDPLTTYSDGVATITKTLDAMTKYEFKMYNVQESAYYKNTGKIITDISGWDYTSGDGANTFLYTGPAGVYTFKFTLAGRLLQVIYPSVSHPAEGYAYFQQQGGWSACRIYQWDTGGGELTSWENALTISNTANICGTTYYYFALANEYNRVKFRDNGSNQGNELATSGYSAKYTGNNFSSPSWNAFEKYTISFNSGGGSGTMTAISDLCPGSDQAITTNSFTRSNYTFTGWTANVDVKIGGSTVTAGTLIANGATIQDIQSNITLTAQWIQTPVITRSPSVIAFGNKKIDGSYTESFTVSGSNLVSTSGLTLAVMGSNTGMYSIDKTEIAQTSAGTVASTTVTVTYHPTTAGSHAGADVRITTSNGVGGTITVSVTLSGTGVYEDTFIDMLQNTTGYTEGSPHTEQGAYGTTPSLSDKSVATSGTCQEQHYHFVGWITAAKYAAGTAISDGDLQTPTTASNATYYAVWAKQAAGGGSTTITLTNSEIESGRDGTNNYSTSYNIDGWTGKYAVPKSSDNYALQIGRNTDSSKGAYNSHITTPSIPSGATITSITLTPHTNWTTSSGRTFYLLSSDNIGYTAASDQGNDYGVGSCATDNAAVTITTTNSPTQCHIWANGTAYIESISLTYSTISYTDYKAICCTDWSTPAVTYSSSLAIGGTASVSIGSGTTHGAVTYESSDEDVLTVESDGTVTAVGAGTAHIIATWAGDATYCEKSTNSNDISVSGILVTGTTPVNFGQVYQNAVVANKTISVTGINLASAITPSLPAGSPFSFSPASLAANSSGATLTISASTATLGNYNQTLTLTSGAFSTTVTVKMEVIAMPSCEFVDNLHNLTVDASSVPLSSYALTAAQGTAVVFPTLANQVKGASTCEDQHYRFVGWTTSDNNTDPEGHLVTSHTLANGDAITYYAVWADGVPGVTYTKLTSNTFKTSPTRYVLGGANADSGTDYYLYSCTQTDKNNSWGYLTSDPATNTPIEFTLSGTAGELVATSTEATARYLKDLADKDFQMSASSKSVELKSDGTIFNNNTGETSYRLLYNKAGGLRWYSSNVSGSTNAYFYEVGAGSVVSYRTSCCTNKVEAPTVTATKTSTSITLTWDDETGATGWEVSWNGGAFGSPSGTRTHTVSGLTPNTTYTWQVRATYTTPKCGADIASGSTTTNQVYHVTYAKGDGEANCSATGTTTDGTAYEAGTTVTLQDNEFTLVGHVFAGWTEDDDDITISSNQFTMPDHDVVITASWTAKVDKYFDRMHDQTDALHGGVVETEGTNEGKYYIAKTGCNYSIPTAVDSNTGDACQTSHYKLQGWIAQSYVNANGEITDTSKIFPPTGTKTATGATYYAVWAEVSE